MFKEIYVKNFILIDQLHLDFTKGFSVFTGETGAGKSLLIDAISLLCGSRASFEYVTQGKEYALVEGVFSLDNNHPVLKELDELGIEIEDDLIITRKITSDGKSSVKINHRSVSLSMLKNIMSQMIDIHSQHDTQYLLNSKSHLSLLDEYCHIDDLLNECKTVYKSYKEALDNYNDCLNGELNEDIDFLRYQLNEIEEADISEEKVNEYQDELKNLNNFEKLNENLSKCYDLLSGNDQTLEILYEAIRKLENLKDFDWTEKMISDLNDYYYGIEEISSLVNDQLNRLDYDENRVNEINQYLYTFNNLKRKYGNSVQSILNKKDELIQRIELIENRQEVLDRLERNVKSTYKEYRKVADEISKIRKEKAIQLQKDISKECSDLYLDKTRFEVRFIESDATSNGIDKVEFFISMNPGEPLKPLVSVASGGELSRLMLGLKTIFTSLTSIETIIFDEIDTGVSGNVALAIGKKMRQISENHQLFAITHLASVAACANNHYVVEKKQKIDSTHTNIRELDYDEIIQSLAQIANNSLSETALNAAKELYELAQSK